MHTPSTRAESNRLNSRRSTGPKTAAGKARSSRNALKHGLAVEALSLTLEDPEVVAARSRAMADSLKPEGEIECEMSNRAALLALRLERCAAAEAKRTADQVRRAIADHDEAIRGEVARIAAKLPSDPAGTLRKLKRTAQGVDHLVGLWQDIRDTLAIGADLQPRDHDSIARLLGRHPEASGFPPILMMARGAIRGDFAESSNPMVDFQRREMTKISSRHRLDALIEAEIDRLEAHRSTLPHAQAAQDRREAPLRAVVDLSHQGMLLRRYETAAAREIHKIFAYFDGIRFNARPAPIDASRDQTGSSVRLASFRNSGDDEGGPRRFDVPAASREGGTGIGRVEPKRRFDPDAARTGD